MHAESAAAKELFRRMRDDIARRRWALNNGRADTLQLLVPGAHREDLLKKVHTGMTGGHLSAKTNL